MRQLHKFTFHPVPYTLSEPQRKHLFIYLFILINLSPRHRITLHCHQWSFICDKLHDCRAPRGLGGRHPHGWLSNSTPIVQLRWPCYQAHNKASHMDLNLAQYWNNGSSAGTGLLLRYITNEWSIQPWPALAQHWPTAGIGLMNWLAVMSDNPSFCQRYLSILVEQVMTS